MFILHNLRKYIINLSRTHLNINRNDVGINRYNGYSEKIITQYGYFDIAVLYYNRRQVIERDPYIYAEMDYFVESTRYIFMLYLNICKDLVEIAFVNYNKITVYKIDNNTIKSIITYIFPKHTDETSKWYNKITTVILNDKYLKYEYIGNYQRRPCYGDLLNKTWNVVHRVKYNKHTKLPVYSEYINEGYYQYQQTNPKHTLKCYYDKYGRAKKYRIPCLGLLQRI